MFRTARHRFYAALALYLVWLAVLAGMIAVEGRRPAPRQLVPPASAAAR